MVDGIKKRYDFIDFAKAIAITLMVIYHTSPSYPTLGAFRMSTFLLLGGLFAKGNESSFSIVLKKGIVQLIIPYFILNLIAFPFCWISPYLHPELYYNVLGFGEIFKRAFFGIFLFQDKVTPFSFLPCGPLWFLPALFWCRIFFYLWSSLETTRFKYLYKLVLLGGLFVIYKLNIVVFSLSPGAIAFPFFLIGNYSKKYILEVITSFKTSLILLIITFFILFIIMLDSHIIGFANGGFAGSPFLAYIRCLMGTSVILFCVILIDRFCSLKLKKYLSWIGSATIAILGLHLIILYGFKFLYSLMGYNPSNIPFLLAIPVAIIIVSFVTLIYHKILTVYLPLSIGKGNLSFLDRLLNSTKQWKLKFKN